MPDGPPVPAVPLATAAAVPLARWRALPPGLGGVPAGATVVMAQVLGMAGTAGAREVATGEAMEQG